MAKKTTAKIKNTPKPNVRPSSLFTKYKWDIFIFAFSVLLYANTIPNDYNMDDELVTRNHRLTAKGISAIPEIFTSTYYKDESGYAYEYRPVVLSSFAIEHQFFGDNPHVSHFFNMLLYALMCLLLFRVLLILKLHISPLLSFAITLLFIVHPAHTEVVASIKNRDELLAFTFVLMSVYITLKAIYSNRSWQLIFTPMLFALALMSKMTAFSFVLIIPIIIIFFTNLNFYKVMMRALLFVVPAAGLISNINGLYRKGEFAIEIMILIAIVYGLINISIVNNFIRSVILRAKSYIHIPSLPAFIEDTNRQEFNFKEFVSQAIPDYSFLSFRSIGIPLCAGAIYFFGMVTEHNSLIIIGAVSLLLLIAGRQEKDSFWANIVFSCCLVFPIVRYPSQNFSLYWILVFIILVYQIFTYHSKLLIPSIVLLLCMFCFSLPPEFLSDITLLYAALSFFLILMPLLSIIYKNKKFLVFPSIILSVGVLFIVVCRLVGSGNLGHIGMPQWFIPTLGILVFLLFRWNIRYPLFIYRFIAIVVLLLLVRGNPHPMDDGVTLLRQIRSNTNNYIISANKIDIKVLPAEQNRPLLYMEQPVTLMDPFAIRAGTSLEIMLLHLHKVVLPYPMAFYYGFKFIKPINISSSIGILSLILYSILMILALIFIYKDRIVSLGLIIYLISSVAACNYFIPIPGQFGERFLLIPSLGWAIILATVLFRVFRIDPAANIADWVSLHKVGKYLFAVIILFYSSLTFSRNFEWKDDLTLFRHDVKYVDQSAQAHNLLALHLMQRTDLPGDSITRSTYISEALGHFKRAYEIYPFYNVAFDLGRVYGVLNMPDSAIFYFNKAIDIDSTNAIAYLNAGKLLLSQQKYEKATPYFETIIRLSPNEYMGYENLSLIYYNLKSYNKSIQVNKTAVRLMPSAPDPLINIGIAFSTMNELDSAKSYYREALRVNPGNAKANYYLLQSPPKAK